jgi:hypothetical protein
MINLCLDNPNQSEHGEAPGGVSRKVITLTGSSLATINRRTAAIPSLAS